MSQQIHANKNKTLQKYHSALLNYRCCLYSSNPLDSRLIQKKKKLKNNLPSEYSQDVTLVFYVNATILTNEMLLIFATIVKTKFLKHLKSVYVFHIKAQNI